MVDVEANSSGKPTMPASSATAARPARRLPHTIWPYLSSIRAVPHPLLRNDLLSLPTLQLTSARHRLQGLVPDASLCSSIYVFLGSEINVIPIGRLPKSCT